MDVSAERHDATTGFHDIKAVPGVSGAEGSAVWSELALMVLALCVLAAIVRFRRKRQIPPIHHSPLAQFRTRIAPLRGSPPEARTLGLLLSEALRAYLEPVLQLPAVELTPREINERLPERASMMFPSISPAERAEVNRRIFDFLKKLEQMTFGSEQVVALAISPSGSVLAEAEAIVETIEYFQAEETRRRSITQQVEEHTEERNAV